MDLKQLECFFAVVDELHFGQAALKLHRSQASVSENVRSLEQELGGQLFTRTTRRVRLTEFGERTALRLRPPYEELLRGYRALRSVRLRSEIVVAYTPQLGAFFLPHWVAYLLDNDLADLADEWSPRVLHSDQQIEGVLSGAIDVGLCWNPTPHPGLGILRLGVCPVVVIMRDSEPLASGPVELPVLRDHRVLLSPATDNPGFDTQLRLLLTQAGLSAAQCVEVESYDQLGLAVVAGRGIGLHPATISRLNRNPGLAFLSLQADDSFGLEIAIVYRADEIDERINRFVEMFGEVARDALAALQSDFGLASEGKSAE